MKNAVVGEGLVGCVAFMQTQLGRQPGGLRPSGVGVGVDSFFQNSKIYIQSSLHIFPKNNPNNYVNTTNNKQN